jgi:hypothetical protein
VASLEIQFSGVYSKIKYSRAVLLLILFITLIFAQETFSQNIPILEKTERRQIQDVEVPSIHSAPFAYYKPTIIFLNQSDTTKGYYYWRRNFTDQFLENYSDSRFYPATLIYGFIQDSVYYRSTPFDDYYHIFAPQILSGPINLYYTREIQNLGEIRLISKDATKPDYHNNMIVTGTVPRRYANNYTYFVTFPWDTLKMISVNRGSLPVFARTYLRAYPTAYKEASKYYRSNLNRALTYTLLPIAVAGTAAFLLAEGNPTYFIAIGVGALVTYVAVKIFVKPKTLDPEAMIGIIEKCK